jgi:ABC-type multidrug transport system permease subunit
MNLWLDGFRAVAWKEVMHIRRDRASLVFALLIPMVQIVLFGFAIDFDVRYVSTVVVDLDQSRESRDFLAGLKNTQYMLVTSRVATPQQAEAQIRTGEARVAVIVPPDFARRSGAGDHPQVQVLIDGSDSQVANRVIAALHPVSLPEGAVEPRLQLLYNPDGRTATFTIPGLIGVILQLVTVSLTSLSLVREKEQGTLEQVMVSPISRSGLMLGKIVPYFALGLMEMVTVLIIGWLVFDVHVAGSLVGLMLMTVPFLLSTLGLGLVISTLSQTQAQAVQLTILTLLPSVLLSGFVFPRDSMPGPLYVLSCIIPVTHYVEILRGVMIRSAGIVDLWDRVLALCVIAGVLVTVAATRFRKSVS